MRVYLAGPMTGIPQFNLPAFIAYSERLRAAGFEVVSPVEIDNPDEREVAMASPDGIPAGDGPSWGEFLSRDVRIVADDADAVMVMPGWDRSRGARVETFLAFVCGKPIFDADAPDRVIPFENLQRAWAGEGSQVERDVSLERHLLDIAARAAGYTKPDPAPEDPLRMAGDDAGLRAFADARTMPGPIRAPRDWTQEVAEELSDACNYCSWAIQQVHGRYLAGDADAADVYERHMRVLSVLVRAWHELRTASA